MFTSDGLSRFLKDLPDGVDIVDALPAPGQVGLTQYADQAVDEVIRKGIDRATLFAALRDGGFGRQDDIAEVESLWIANPPESRPLQEPLAPLIPRVRSPSPDFVGRINETAGVMGAVTGTNRVAVITGLGGVGKTELARLVASRLREQFPGGAIEIKLGGSTSRPLSSAEAVRRVVTLLRPGQALPEDDEGLEAVYRGLLAQQRILVIADDARNAATVRALSPPEGAALIVTSRRRFAVAGVDENSAIDLRPLEPDFAHELARRIAPRARDFAEPLAEACGRLPLALRVAASVLAADDTINIAAFLAQLVDQRKALAALRDPDDPELDVEASIAQSFVQLEKPLLELFPQLGVFAGSFDLSAAEAVVEGVAREERAQQLGRLRRHGLIEWDPGERRYELQLLVRAFALTRLENEAAVRLRHAKFYVRVASEAQRLWARGGDERSRGRDSYSREQANIDNAWTWAFAAPASAERDELLLAFAEAAEGVIDNAAYSIDTRRSYLEAALEAAERLNAPDRRREIAVKLGMLLMGLSKLLSVGRRTREAIRELERSWAMFTSAGAAVAAEFAAAVLSELADLYTQLGEPDAAIERIELWASIAAGAGDHEGEGRARAELVTQYVGSDRLAAAAKELRRAKELLGFDDTRLAKATGNVAIGYANQGKARTAYPLATRALTLARNGTNQVVESAMLSLLARLDDERGQPTQAVRRLRQYIAVMDQRVMQSVTVRRATAEVLGQAVGGGPIAQWQSEFRQLLDDLYDAHGRLAQLLATLGDLESAADHLEIRRAAMEGLNDRLGQASALFGLARVAQAAGRAPAALEYFDGCIALIDQDGPPAHDLLLDALYDSAKLLFGREQFEPAAERLERALALARAHAPEQVIGIVRNLGVTEIKLLRPASAAQRFDEAAALASAAGLPTAELQQFADEARVLARLQRKLKGAGAGDEAR